MAKIIKLLVLAAVLVGAVILLINVMDPTPVDPETPTFTSAQANMWKNKIDSICEGNKWRAEEYKLIESGIHTDRATSQGTLISLDEENALQSYLFMASCNSLKNRVDQLFKQSNYPETSLTQSKEMLTFLEGKVASFGSNSNLTEASNMLSEYRQLLATLAFPGASYSHPLRPFNALSADAAQKRIKSLKHYGSHFSKNATIKNKVDNYASNRANAESDYYSNLERAIEKRSRSARDINELLDDQIQFNKMSTNPRAVTTLNNFVKNPNRWD